MNGGRQSATTPNERKLQKINKIIKTPENQREINQKLILTRRINN